MSDIAARFAHNLSRCRADADLSQEEVGVRASLHHTEISQLERGLRVARIDTLVKLAGALEVTPLIAGRKKGAMASQGAFSGGLGWHWSRSVSPAIGSFDWMELATRSEQSGSIVSRHHPVGASTGYMQDLRGNWDAQVRAAWQVSPFAVELSALSETELPALSRYLGSGRSLPFRYISIHGPSKHRQMDEEKLVSELVQLASYANGVVMHPDTFDQPELYRPLGHKLLIENMDARKPTGRTPEELEATFAELPEAGFCFDIAHAWSIDPGMSVAAELLDRLGGRLRHVHLSSLSADLHHVSLTAEHEELFRPALERCVDVPWIFEAPPSR